MKLKQQFVNILTSKPRLLVDTAARNPQNSPVAFHQAAGFDSPNTKWQTSRPKPFIGGIFTSAFPCCTFPTGNRGTGGLAPAGFTLSSLSTRFLLFPALTFDSVKRGFKTQSEKVHIIMAVIRKGYSRPLITQSIRNFSSLSEASRYIDGRLKDKPKHCFNIQQTAPDTWTVARVVSGGAA